MEKTNSESHQIDVCVDSLTDTTALCAPDVVGETLDEAVDFYGREDPSNTKKRRQVPQERNAWSKEEEDEIKKLLKICFDTKTRPTPAQCLKAITKSRANKGLIANRKKDVLKKKVFRMIDKLIK